MKGFAVLLFALLFPSCVRSGIAERMEAVLDRMEAEMGYVNTLNNSDVEKVAAWFERHGDDARKAVAYYCLGRNQFNTKNFSAAIVTYTRALDYAVSASDTLTVAKVCYDMAHTGIASGNPSDAVYYLARSAEAFKAAGRGSESLRALLEIGQAQSGLGKFHEAEAIFQSVLYDAHASGDTLVEVRCLEAYAELSVSRDQADPGGAIDFLGRAANELRYPLSSGDKGILAYSYSLEGKAEESRKWLSEAKASAETDGEIAAVKFREYQIASHNGDLRTALSALERVMEYGNKAQTSALEEAVATSQREYIQQQLSIRNEKLTDARIRFWLLVLASVLALCAASAVFLFRRAEIRRKLEEEKAETEKYMDIAEDLRRKLSAGQTAAAGSGTGPGGSLRDRKYDALERLCEQYYVYEGTDSLQPKIFKEVKAIVEGLRADRKTQQALENRLDTVKNGVMTKLRSEFPSWKREDFLLYGFTAAGFSSTTISTLLQMEKNVVYNRLYRLKGRISGSQSTLRDFFLECLDK